MKNYKKHLLKKKISKNPNKQQKNPTQPHHQTNKQAKTPNKQANKNPERRQNCFKSRMVPEIRKEQRGSNYPVLHGKL